MHRQFLVRAVVHTVWLRVVVASGGNTMFSTLLFLLVWFKGRWSVSVVSVMYLHRMAETTFG